MCRAPAVPWPPRHKKSAEPSFFFKWWWACCKKRRKVDAMWQPLKINSGPWGPGPPINLLMTMAASYSVTDALEMDRLRVTWIISRKSGVRSECGRGGRRLTGPVSLLLKNGRWKQWRNVCRASLDWIAANAERAGLYNRWVCICHSFFPRLLCY